MDLRRVELRSAQGNHTLSTCLFQPLVFEHWQDLNHQPMPYPLNLHLCNEAYTNYFRFNLHRFTLRFGTTSLEQCLVQLSNSRIKPVIYCTSIRQRERNYFRQLKILKSDIKVREQQLTTCLLTPSSRCQSQSAPCVLSQEKTYYALTL